MSTTIIIPIAGTVQINALVNVRQGQPTRKAAVARKLPANTLQAVTGLVVGEDVQGNAHWYAIADGGFIWAGACGSLQSSATGAGNPAPSAGTSQPAHSSDITAAGLDGFGLTPEFAAKLAELILVCRENGHNFKISQGLRPPETQATYYCQWAKRSPAMIDAQVTMLRNHGARWLAALLASKRDITRIPKWQTNALPGAGWHQWGEAADCYCHRGGKLVGNGDDPSYVFYATQARRVGLTAGYYFKDRDAGHVQLRSAGGATDMFNWAEIDATMKERFGQKPFVA
jgi:hypothetical protein